MRIVPLTIDRAPRVEHEGLVLCGLEPRDVDVLDGNNRDPETAARFGWVPDDAARWRCEQWVDEAAALWRSGERAVFAVRASADGPLLGTVEARPEPHTPGTTSTGSPVVELSWNVMPDHRGRRIASRAVRGIIRWCASVGIDEVWAKVEHTNRASLRVAHAAGLRPEHADQRWVYLRTNISSDSG